MKTPDKIYMPNELLSEEWQRHIEGEDACYIRKDALLEWAMEELEFAENTDFNSFVQGQIVTYRRIIDKLNRM